MYPVITQHRDGFGPGFTAITTAGEPHADTGISLGVLKLAAGERYTATLVSETAYLLMDGSVAGRIGAEQFELSRNSLFDDSPACVHASAGTPVEIRASTAAEQIGRAHV